MQIIALMTEVDVQAEVRVNVMMANAKLIIALFKFQEQLSILAEMLVLQIAKLVHQH